MRSFSDVKGLLVLFPLDEVTLFFGKTHTHTSRQQAAESRQHAKWWLLPTWLCGVGTALSGSQIAIQLWMKPGNELENRGRGVSWVETLEILTLTLKLEDELWSGTGFGRGKKDSPNHCTRDGCRGQVLLTRKSD